MSNLIPVNNPAAIKARRTVKRFSIVWSMGELQITIKKNLALNNVGVGNWKIEIDIHLAMKIGADFESLGRSKCLPIKT